MSRTFTKLFSSITESTIWVQPDHTRIVWITMLAMADHAGRVWGSIPGLANRARVPVESAEQAIEAFLKPDKYSRTKEHNGIRIEAIDGGWRLLNHAKYRAIRDEESIKETKRNYINVRRAKEREGVDNVDRSRPIAEAYTEAEADKEESKSKPLSVLAEPDVILSQVKRVWDYYIRLFKRKDALYKFTDKRKAKGLARYMDCLKLAVGDQEQASLLMKQAVDSLHASEYHVTGGYYDWIDNLFKSTEQLQKWLDKPKVKTNGQTKQDERTQKNRETITAVLSEIAGRDGAISQDGDSRGNDKSHERRPQPLLGSGDP